ncbi:MAG: hypothetical protein RR209_04290 [Angelakisella sp.]
MKVICQKRVQTLDKNGAIEKGRYIDKGDICTVWGITQNLLVEISYPTSGGVRTAYIKSLEDFLQG